MIAGTATYAVANGGAAGASTVIVNAWTGQPLNHGLGTSFLLGTFLPLASGEAFLVGAGGEAIFGSGVSAAFGAYSAALGTGAALLNPNSTHSMAPKPHTNNNR